MRIEITRLRALVREAFEEGVESEQECERLGGGSPSWEQSESKRKSEG